MAKINIEGDKESVSVEMHGTGIELMWIYSEITQILTTKLSEKLVKSAFEMGIE